MKLSDVKGDRVFDVIADIIEPIANIAEDENASNLFHKEKLPDGMTPKGFVIQRVKKSLPALLKGHKDDMISILSTIEGVTAKEYAQNLDLLKLTRDFIDLVTDETFNALFISAQSEEPSGDTSVSTEAQTA